MNQNVYALVDSGNSRKLERFGPYLIARPSSQALWLPKLPEEDWLYADATLTREGERLWTMRRGIPDSWEVNIADLTMRVKPTDFGHLGLFPEQRSFWEWIRNTIRKKVKKRPIHLLNLFAYSGGATLAAAQAGAAVCHLDASKGMVSWARENAHLNKLEDHPIRWIVDDVSKFLNREQRRNSFYDAIILDPPTFGRGNRGEVFKIEEQIVPLLKRCRTLLSPQPLFILLSCHTPGITPVILHHLLQQATAGLSGTIDMGEMLLTGSSEEILTLPSGSFARWTCDD